VSDGSDTPAKGSTDGDGSGVLANLPRTRPQRASPRRAAARATAEKASAPAQRKPGERAGARGSKPASAKGRRASTEAKQPSVNGSTGARAAERTPAGSAGKQSSRKGARRRGAGARESRLLPVPEAVPSQGYESEEDAATGPVPPPGGAELFMSAAEIVGELAKAGLSRSERLIKDALSRLPLS
jgi:hypothetical protein